MLLRLLLPPRAARRPAAGSDRPGLLRPLREAARAPRQPARREGGVAADTRAARLGGAPRGRGRASPPAPPPLLPAPPLRRRSPELSEPRAVRRKGPSPGWVSRLGNSLHWRWVLGISGPILVMAGPVENVTLCSLTKRGILVASLLPNWAKLAA